MASLRASFNMLSRTSLRAAAAPSSAVRPAFIGGGSRFYSAKAEEAAPAAEGEAAAPENAELLAAQEKLETQAKTIAELKVRRLSLSHAPGLAGVLFSAWMPGRSLDSLATELTQTSPTRRTTTCSRGQTLRTCKRSLRVRRRKRGTLL